jgi:hypothetical protein
MSSIMHRPVEVEARPDYRIWIRYQDGSEGEVDLSNLAGRGVFNLWDDYTAFENVRIADDGAIRWSEDVELCPDAMYMKLTGQSHEEALTSFKTQAHA